MFGNLLPSLVLLTSASIASVCPSGLVLQADHRCHYDIRYLKQLGQTGLQKSFAHSDDGMDPQQIALGKLLFFDPILSRDKDLSCAHCHQPARGFSDGLAQSKAHGLSLPRSAPTLWNVAFSPALFWDGRATNLEQQARGPLFSPAEMAMTPELIEKRLNQIPEYRNLFLSTFESDYITAENVISALASFERTLVSFNSRYDRYVFGEPNALNDEEVRGLNVFRSFVTRCTECHTPPLFTNFQTAIIGVPDGNADPGMAKTTGETRLTGAFRVPTLRNIGLTAPYTHAGSFKTLADVVDFYDRGGGRHLPHPSAYLHWHIREMGLSVEEKKALVAFLLTLTDESLLPETPSRVPSGLKPLPGPHRPG